MFQEYLEFISKYGKTQLTQEQFEYRYSVFTSNYLRIVTHNAIPDSGFELEINQFADMTDAEFIKGYTGIIVPDHKTKALMGTSVPVEETEGRRLKELPQYKNWYKEGAVTRPYDQAGCGGCWAFSACSAAESVAYINKVDETLQEYSVQQLLDCD